VFFVALIENLFHSNWTHIYNCWLHFIYAREVLR